MLRVSVRELVSREVLFVLLALDALFLFTDTLFLTIKFSLVSLCLGVSESLMETEVLDPCFL